MNRGSMIDARGLTKVYGDSSAATVTAVRDVHLHVEAGEVVLVTGVSGSGKTTLLSILGGMLEPTTGEVHLAGQAVHTLGAAHRAAFRLRRVGFVFQQFRLLSAITAMENVEIVMHLAGRTDEEAREKRRHM